MGYVEDTERLISDRCSRRMLEQHARQLAEICDRRNMFTQPQMQGGEDDSTQQMQQQQQ